MGHFVMVSLWCLMYTMFHQKKKKKKKLPNDSGRPLSYNDFTDKNKTAVTKKQCFFVLFF